MENFSEHCQTVLFVRENFFNFRIENKKKPKKKIKMSENSKAAPPSINNTNEMQ